MFLLDGLFARPFCEDESGWESVLSAAEYVPIDYTVLFVQYQNAYLEGKSELQKDLSMVFYQENKPVCVWPLFLGRREGLPILGSNTGAILPPLFIRELGVKFRKRLCQAAFLFLKNTARNHKIEQLTTIDTFLNQFGLGIWHEIWMRAGAKSCVRHELFVDLSLEISALKSNLRKSYKSLISSGERAWHIDYFSPGSLVSMSELRDLHIQVSGRVTRSERSWNFQERAIHKGEAFLLLLREKLYGRLIGGALFHISRHEGYYAVGVYDRTLFDKPLGHVIQMRALQEMKSLNIQWYRIGRRFFGTEEPVPTSKEVSISEFKEGFSTHLFPKIEASLTLG